ncbi:MAG: aldehyde-activating protein [Phyllobacteriaceae bacterium]|nr:aldehyde-activating protein [Phyllobacteriaceae bacterium]
MTARTLSGGCQCGAVRFRVTGNPGTSSVCHCRMCQKASAAPFLALVGPGEKPVEWTRGAPAWFQSSSAARRGFCAACGTPLAYDAPDGLALTVIAFDDPDAVAPTIAYGVEGKRPWCDAVPDLPQRATLDDIGAAPFLDTLTNLQHPDHDTQEWPPHADG